MAFTLQNLMADTRFLLFNDSTNTDYGDTDLKRNINRWYNTGLSWILKADGQWQVDGEKTSTDLIAGQSDYSLPDDLLKINEVYIKYQTNGEYIKAEQRDPAYTTQDPDNNYYPGIPQFDLMDNSIYIYLPTSIPDMQSGLKVFYQSDITELANNTDLPNIAEPFKRLLSVGSAYDYCLANELWNKAKKFENLIFQIIKSDLLEHYANRSTSKQIVMIPEESNNH